MAEQADQEIYIYMGGNDVVPRDATRVRVHEAVKVIPAGALYEHPNLVEFECHDGVERIERNAFYRCPSLKRVKIPGVTVVEEYAFYFCVSLTDVECDKLERIGDWAFRCCKSLRRATLPSIEIVEAFAFAECEKLMVLTFGDKLESIGESAFYYCVSLKRITIPLKDGIITDDDVFQRCKTLECVDLVDEVHETIAASIAALQLKNWRKAMNKKICRINQILPTTPAGSFFGPGGKANVIRVWITSVLRKMEHYKTKHLSLLKEAATTLELALWKKGLSGDNDVPEGDEKKRAECRNDCGADMSIIIPNVLSFLKIE